MLWPHEVRILVSALWGCSLAGRASALHAEGQEFDPPHLHQNYLMIIRAIVLYKKELINLLEVKRKLINNFAKFNLCSTLNLCYYTNNKAFVLKLVDRPDSESGVRKNVSVRVRPKALIINLSCREVYYFKV